MSDFSTDVSVPIVVGRIVSLHGVSGAVKTVVLSDVPERFNEGQILYVRGNAYTIASATETSRYHLILKFQGVDSPETARSLVGQQATVPESSVPSLPEGEYYHFQLLGLKVRTDEGEELGEIKEILETGSNDVYVVSKDSKELLIPALADVILDVLLEDGVMVVSLPDGLR